MGFFTDEQISKLNEKLNPALVKTREQSGIKLSYIDGYTAIKHANEIFGYGNWESKIKDLRQIELATITKETRSGTREGWRASYICIHEITVYGANGESRTFSDVGFGSGVSYSSPGDAVESAVKEAATDALKRTLRFFGPQFGLDLYSEDERREQGLDGRLNGTVQISLTESGVIIAMPNSWRLLQRSSITQTRFATNGSLCLTSTASRLKSKTGSGEDPVLS